MATCGDRLWQPAEKWCELNIPSNTSKLARCFSAYVPKTSSITASRATKYFTTGGTAAVSACLFDSTGCLIRSQIEVHNHKNPQ